MRGAARRPAESAAFGRAEGSKIWGRLLRPEGPPGRADGPARAGAFAPAKSRPPYFAALAAAGSN